MPVVAAPKALSRKRRLDNAMASWASVRAQPAFAKIPIDTIFNLFENRSGSELGSLDNVHSCLPYPTVQATGRRLGIRCLIALLREFETP
jgi:hypothetical protein